MSYSDLSCITQIEVKMKIEDTGIDLDALEHAEMVSISDVMIAINETLGRHWCYSDSSSMRQAVMVLEYALKRKVLWGQPQCALMLRMPEGGCVERG